MNVEVLGYIEEEGPCCTKILEDDIVKKIYGTLAFIGQGNEYKNKKLCSNFIKRWSNLCWNTPYGSDYHITGKYESTKEIHQDFAIF